MAQLRQRTYNASFAYFFPRSLRDARLEIAPQKTQKIPPLSHPCDPPPSGNYRNCVVRTPSRFRDLIPYIGLTAAVLAYLSEKTSILDITEIVKTLENPTPSSNSHLDIRQVQAVYTILRYTPMEYLPRSIRIDLTKKAVVFDAQLISASKPGLAHNDLMGVLSLSREYISRSIMHAAVFDRRVLVPSPLIKT